MALYPFHGRRPVQFLKLLGTGRLQIACGSQEQAAKQERSHSKWNSHLGSDCE